MPRSISDLIQMGKGGSACDLGTSSKPLTESYLTAAFLKMCADTIGAHRSEDILPVLSTKSLGLRSVCLGSQGVNG